MRAAEKALDVYRAKRDFTVTREPSGARRAKKAAEAGLSFVVQKHAARRLHYDFRLELDGVLKSWAVAKGPSLVAGEKRLAVHVEDHPLEYGGFEGIIPEGQYGAGAVIVWDRGRWIPQGDPEHGFAKGHLSFELDGEKLRGGWHLVRMAPKEGQRGDNWLLIKADDSFARDADAPDILEEARLSVLSGKPIEAVASDQSSRKWTSGKPATTAVAPAALGAGLSPRQRARAALSEGDPAPKPRAAQRSRGAPENFIMPKAARKTKSPGFAEPCLATAVTAPPNGRTYVHELKFDGYRLQPELDEGTVVIRTRRGLDWTKKFPAIAAAIAGLPAASAILDGEAVVEDQNGVADFAALQDALKTQAQGKIAFYIFDLLYLDGYDLRAATLVERKGLLRQLLQTQPTGGVLRYSEHFSIDGDKLLRHICALNAEGIVSKRTDSPYRSGRGRDWLKVKCANRQEFVIIGFTPSTAAPKAIGSLALGFYEDGKLLHAGRAGTGFDAETASALFVKLDKIKSDKPSVSGALPAEARRNLIWTAPKLVAEIEFRGWTSANILRQASFKALRDDKPPNEVVREVAVSSTQPPAPAQQPPSSAPPQTSVKLTHPDRVLWPQGGITKRALADFYASVWDLIAPHIVGRPLALVRCPTGIGPGCFFQKHQWEGSVGHVVLTVDPGDEKPLVGIEDFDGLMALVQASVLEIHPWGAKAENLDAPDRLIFDLDPGDGILWRDLVAGAREARARLRSDGLESFVKTSGGKGLHVIAPIRPQSSWDDAKAYCRSVAEAMAAAFPSRFTATMAKRERSGRIYVDYLRNARGSTAVAAYSTRARPEAGVSTPLDWSELDSIERADHFTLANFGHRLQTLRADPWAEMATATQALPGKKSSPRRAKK
jgi:bifunctional non-homologous end joining protein LigD